MPLNNNILLKVNELKDNTTKTSKTYDLPLPPAADESCKRNISFDWESDNFCEEAVVWTKIAEDRKANPMSLDSTMSDESMPQGFSTPPQKYPQQRELHQKNLPLN